MPQEVLEPPCVHSPGRQCVSHLMPQHVDMHRERQPSGFSSPFNHASDAHPAERLATLIDEYVCPFPPFSLLLPLKEFEAVHLIPLELWRMAQEYQAEAARLKDGKKLDIGDVPSSLDE